MIIILMGVSGTGKTTIGKYLATELNGSFYDADDFHPPANIEKMSQGIALTDADRGPWLNVLRQHIDAWIQSGELAILACSALKHAYRRELASGHQAVYFVYLKGDFDLIQQRLASRSGHYMPADLLSSQFQTLEEPEDALTIDIAQDPATIVQCIQQHISSWRSTGKDRQTP